MAYVRLNSNFGPVRGVAGPLYAKDPHMTAITADFEGEVSLLGPRFAAQFLRATEPLTAILAQRGIARAIAWANLGGR